jgi:uncharacterized protein
MPMRAEPSVWVLTRRRKGDLDQMLALVKAVGWSYDVKTLSFAGPDIPVLSNLLLRTNLTPPWPDLVLCAEASPSVVARSIRRQSHGRSRIVCLGRPAGSATDFDLVITTAQYRIPPAPNVVELAMPLAQQGTVAASPSPDGPIVVLVGGPAFPDLFDPGTAARLASDARAHASRRKATLDVLTSPRTPPAAIAALESVIKPPHRLTIFGRGENRYASALAAASEVIVTSDSVSMLADALAAGKPVSVYCLPQARALKWQLGEWLYRHAIEKPHPLFAPARYLFDTGIIEAAADRRRLFQRLAAERRLAWFGEPLMEPQPDAARVDLEMAARSLQSLMSRNNTGE